MEPPGGLDTSRLAGFRFGCRPGCALCCFAEPAVDPAERRRIQLRVSGAAFRPAADGFALLASRPDGGACVLLRDLRCGTHDLRPFPCRSFPLTVHLGPVAQASLVWSCPGLDVNALAGWTPGAERAAPVGLDDELAAVEAALAGATADGRREVARRDWDRRLERLRRRGRWPERSGPLVGTRDDPARGLDAAYPAPPPPERSEGGASLPLTHHPVHGRIAFAAGPDGAWTVWPLRAEGGTGPSLGAYAPPTAVPRLTAPARARLVGYLRYVAARQALEGQLIARLEAPDGPRSADTALAEELAETAADVVTRAAVLAALDGRSPDPLDPVAIAAGIRATDADRLDRPGAGRIL